MNAHCRLPRLLSALLGLSLLASACGLLPGGPTPPLTAALTSAPANTAAPATAVLSATATSGGLAVPSATTTAIPAVTETPGGEATADPATTAPVATPTLDPAVPTATALPAGGGTHLAEFVADLTVPDGTDFAPDEAFVKTWQLKNVGTATWTTAYLLVFVSGEHMSGPNSVALPANVPPGQTVDISVDLVAPTKLGPYTGFWMLSTPTGQLFGLGQGGNQPVYVQIDTTVGGGTPQPTAPAGSLSLSAASLSVAEANLSGACPQTFQFNLAFTSQGAGTVTYQLEAVADTPGFVFNLPEPSNSIFTTAGPRTFNVSYNLQFTNAVTGQVWVRFSTPTSLETNRVSFSLTCTP